MFKYVGQGHFLMIRHRKHRTHLYIPDIQARKGVPLDHCTWLGRYIAHRQPSVIIQGGDLWDYKSLSSYDEGKKASEGVRLVDDFNAGVEAIKRIMEPWYGMFDPETGEAYHPELYFTRGNHENRRNRYENDYPKLEGALPNETEFMRDLGWTCPEFLEPITVDGIAYSHYFCRGANGKVNQSKRGQPSAVAQAKREMCSSIAGHAQGLDSAIVDSCKGRVRAIIAGSFYLHEEEYKSPQGNNHWHGVLWLNRVKDGDFDLTEVSMGYLKETYGDE